MADIRITPALSIMAFTSSLGFKETFTQEVSGSITLYGSGSTGRTDIFSVDGNNGRLFSVSDDLSNSLFSVNTIAGLPVIEAFADTTVNIGKYGAYSFQALGNGNAGIGSGSVMFVSASGNVGIGTTNPTSLSGYKTLTLDATSGTFTEYRQAGTAIFRVGVDSSRPFFNGMTSANMDFYTNGTFKMTITAAGVVGIGTSSPSAYTKLHVDGNKALVRTTESGWGQFAVANPNDAETGITWAAGGTGYPGNDSTYTRQWIAGLSPFATGTDRWSLTNKTLGASTVLTALEDGKVGIGTTNPGSRLQVGNAGTSPSGLATLTLTGANTAPEIATKPGLYHRAAIGLGVFSDYAMSFEVNGSTTLTEAMRILNDGSVGIGTTAISSKLHIAGQAELLRLQHDAAYIPFYNTANSSRTGYIQYNAGGNVIMMGENASGLILGVGSATRLFINSSGTVGIGTTNPTTYSGYTTLALDNVTNGGLLDLRNNGTSALRLSADSTTLVSIYGATNVPMAFSTNATERIRILAGGNVGIGTTNPATLLQVGFTNTSSELLRIGVSYSVANSQRGAITWHDGGGITSKIWTEYDGSTYTKLNFGGLYSGGSYDQGTFLTIRGNGFVGIGNTVPSYKLMVDGNVNASAVVGISNTATSGHQVYMGYNDGTNRVGIDIEGGGGNSSSYGIQVGTYFNVRDDGRVGIGTTNPSSTLQVVGNVVATSFTGSLLGNVDGTATTATTATNATNVAVTANATNVSRYLTFVANSSGNNGTLVDTDLLYNPSLNLLSINNMWVWKGSSNTALSDNTMIGSGSGANLSAWSAGSADRNTALGYFAGNALTTGRANMMFGFGAGQLLTTGGFNVLIGQQAGLYTNANSYNCALGTLSFFAYGNASAEYNTAIGYRSMQGTGANQSTNSANNNVTIGRDTGFSLSTGTYNVAIGSLAGDSISTGGGNTLIGSGSGENITTGNHNTLVGKYAGTTTLTSTVALSDGLGNIQLWATGGRVSLSGSLAVGAVGVSSTVGRIDASNDIVAYSTSDIHLKENIQPIQDALHKVSLISGNTFDWKSDPELVILHGFEGRDVGVIAQEIESILPEVVTTRDSGYKAVKYEKLVPLLIEAIKELTDKVNKLENK